MLGCVVGGAGTGLWVKFDFGSARSTVVRDRPDLGYDLLRWIAASNFSRWHHQFIICIYSIIHARNWGVEIVDVIY